MTIIVIVTAFSYTTWNDVSLKIYTHGKWETDYVITMRGMAVTDISFINFENSSRTFQCLIS